VFVCFKDEDPVNEIEADEKVVRDPLFQWRCHRLLNLTNLHLYDHSNQDKQLRLKVRQFWLKRDRLLRIAASREMHSLLHDDFELLFKFWIII